MVKRKTWQIQPAKKQKVSLSAALKTEVETKANDLIADSLKPKHVQPPRPGEQLNYVTDIGTKWYRHYFYFIATYACPSPNAISPTFEQKFARMEYVDDSTIRRFDVRSQLHAAHRRMEWVIRRTFCR